jgi:hypothetical protein
MNAFGEHELLPPSLTPMVTTHPAACAYRIERDLSSHSWLHREQVAMAWAVVDLDRERAVLRAQLATAEAERKRLQGEINALRLENQQLTHGIAELPARLIAELESRGIIGELRAK